MAKNDWIDVTQLMQPGMVSWPGQSAPKFEQVSSMSKGEMANLTYLQLSAHTGTHMDAPLHFVDGAADMSAMPLEAMTGLAKVFLADTGKDITRDDLEQAEKRVGEIVEGDKILFKTRFSQIDWILQDFHFDYPGLAHDAANYLAEKKVLVTGIDYLSIAPYDDLVTVHRILLESGIWVIEGLKLGEINEGIHEIVATPLKIQGSDGSPARVLLRRVDRTQ